MQSSSGQDAIDRPFDPPDPVKMTTKLAFRGDRINQYSKGNLIGKGIYGMVYVCRDANENGYELAVKVLKKSHPRDKMKLLRKNYQRETEAGRQPLNSTINNIRKEIATMARCRHANIARLVEVIDDPQHDKIYMIMEYLPGGPILWETDHKPILTLQQTRRIIRDAILGLEYLHYEGIIHRDIKPANLVYTKDRQHVKIIDFGVAHYDPHLAASSKANHITQSRQTEEQSQIDAIDQSLFLRSDINKKSGTPAFLAPETLWFGEDNSDLSPSFSSNGTSSSSSFGNGPAAHAASTSSTPTARERPLITKAIDIWSLGVTLYCFLFGHLPFDVRTSDQPMQHKEFVLYNVILTQDWKVEPFMGAEGVPTAGESSDTQRSGVMEILHRILQKNPQNRITLPELKTHPWILEGIQHPKEWARLTSPGEILKSSNWIKSASLKFLKLIPKNR